MMKLDARRFVPFLTLLAISFAPLQDISSRPGENEQPVESKGASTLFFDPDPSRIMFQMVAGGFNQPLGITHAGDGSGRLFVIERAGRIKILEGGEVLPTPFLDIRSKVKSSSGEQGLLSLAFHPSYATNGRFYVVYTAPRSGDTIGSNLKLEQYTVSSTDPDQADPTSGNELLTIAHPGNSNHNGGTLAFGPGPDGLDDYLYWSTGDGGGGGDPNNNGQNLNSLLGKILRIDVDAAPPYIPPTNPFYGNTSVRQEIWAYGLRNPWRMSFDRLTGDLYIGDVGQGSREEVDFQPASSSGGENYGWRVMEGSLCFNPSSGCSTSDKVLPVAEYSHFVGCSITGGNVYRGAAYPALQGYYFFGDFCTGRVYHLYNPGSGWAKTQIADLPFTITTFGEDEAGNLYLSDYSNGRIYQIQYRYAGVVSIARADPNPTTAANVDFIVTFSESVTGVDMVGPPFDNFILTTSGVSGATVSGVSGSGSLYTVTVATGSGDGTIRLDLIDDDSILDVDSIPIGGVGAGNGNFTSGEAYSIDRTPPTVSSITRLNANPSATLSVSFLVTFSEPVAGVQAADFSLTTSGLSGAFVSNVIGSGPTRTAVVNTGVGDGTLRLNLLDDDTIVDAASNPLMAGFTTGEEYTIDKPDLSPPALRSPRNNAVTNLTTPTFRWTSVNGGSSYEIEVATDDTFTSIVDGGTFGTLSFTPTAPLVDDVYYWHVRARTAGGQPGAWSAIRSFTVDTTGPAAPTLISPLEGASIRSAIFRWGAVPGAAAYEFQLDSDLGFADPMIISSIVRGASRRLPPMPAGIYYWRARAKDALGNWGDWSTPRSINFTGP